MAIMVVLPSQLKRRGWIQLLEVGKGRFHPLIDSLTALMGWKVELLQLIATGLSNRQAMVMGSVIMWLMRQQMADETTNYRSKPMIVK